MVAGWIKDFILFAQMLIYWLLALVILWPIRLLDQIFGTRVFLFLDRLVRRLA